MIYKNLGHKKRLNVDEPCYDQVYKKEGEETTMTVEYTQIRPLEYEIMEWTYLAY